MNGALARDFEEYLGHLAVERGLSVNTLGAYRRDLRRLGSFLEKREIGLSDLDYPLFTAFVIELRETLAAVSVARLVSAVSGLIRFQLREGRLEAHPIPELESPRLEKKLPRVLSRAEVEKLLSAPGNSATGRRDRAMLELLYATGIRAGELVSLSRENLDLEQRMVRVTGKGGRQRLVPFGAPAAEALAGYLAGRPGISSGPVFPGRGGHPLSRQAVWKALRRAALAAGLEGRVYPHILRHSFATHFLAGGAGIRSVQELLGHASLATTQVYTHLDRGRLKDAHRRFHPRP